MRVGQTHTHTQTQWRKDICQPVYHQQLYPEAQAHTRLPAGHPEGYLEAFANIYRNFAMCVRAHISGKKPKKVHMDFPTVDDGVRGMQFIEKVVASSKSKSKWTKF